MVQIKGSKADCPIVLVGNKRDEEAGAREVPTTTGETLQVNTRAGHQPSQFHNHGEGLY